MGNLSVILMIATVALLGIYFAEAHHHHHHHSHELRLKPHHHHHRRHVHPHGGHHRHGRHLRGVHHHHHPHHHHHHVLHRPHRHIHLAHLPHRVVIRKKKPRRPHRHFHKKRPHLKKKKPKHQASKKPKEVLEKPNKLKDIHLNGYAQQLPQDFFSLEHHESPEYVIGFGSPNLFQQDGKNLHGLEIPILKVEQLNDDDEGVYQYQLQGTPSKGAETYVYVKLDQRPKH